MDMDTSSSLAPLLWACTSGAPSYPDEPRIEYRRISSTDVQSGASDSLWITIFFEDGDGDLGSAEFTPCVNTCDVAGCLDSTGIDVFITDSRNECFATVLQLPDLTQDNRIDDISGEIDLKLTGVNCRCIGLHARHPSFTMSRSAIGRATSRTKSPRRPWSSSADRR